MSLLTNTRHWCARGLNKAVTSLEGQPRHNMVIKAKYRTLFWSWSQPFKLVWGISCYAFLMGVTPSLLLGRSSHTPVAAHLKCPLGFHRPESPSPHAGALQNSQRPGISMGKRKCSDARYKKLAYTQYWRACGHFSTKLIFFFPPPSASKTNRNSGTDNGGMWMRCQTRAMKHQVSV